MTKAADVVNERERSCPLCSRQGVEVTQWQHPQRHFVCRSGCEVTWLVPHGRYTGDDRNEDRRELTR